ncbi:TetR family transcriptional regulator [Rhodococcoides trifolii]|uniref:TetR family transcriptional regulator n=1 Tax=Rhodococcoides trifolii TaxID=908250 RepID=A0A917G1D1_9NOCA|nr:TetR family transcriptional regulator [Rhodococcus trifolii]
MVDAYIRLVAAEGYDAATFARLAAEAGLSSTRLISYHFDGKDDVVGAAVGEIYERIGAYFSDAGPLHDLAGYIRSAIGLNVALAAEVRALTTTFIRHRFPAEQPVYSGAQEDGAIGRVADIVREGQRVGTVRADLDPLVVATTVQRSVDALPFTLQSDPELDLDHWAEQLISLFEDGTRHRE